MSCALPVVAPNVGGNEEVISPGINGFLVPPKAPKAMGETILKLLADGDFRERIGKTSRSTIEKCEKCYTWDKIAANHN